MSGGRFLVGLKTHHSFYGYTVNTRQEGDED